MKCKFLDEKCYEFHKGDTAQRCFLCSENSQKLFIVRQIASMKLVHMCGECMVSNFSEYLLDNTRPWEGDKDNSS